MEAVGKDYGNFSFPICDSFTAIFHLGQMCYKLNLDRQLKSKEGMDGGLMLLIDTNIERSVKLPDASVSETRKNAASEMLSRMALQISTYQLWPRTLFRNRESTF